MWYGEQAYYLAHEGVVKLKSMEGILDFNERMFVYHKLHVIIGAAVFKIFEWSVYPLKFVTLFIYLLFFFCLYIYYKQNKHNLNLAIFIVACTLIFLNPNIFLYAFNFRPDILVMVLAFASFLFIDKHLKDENIKWVYLAAIFAGLAFFAHLNGIVVPIAGFILLALYKKYKSLLIFFVVSVGVGSLYFYDLWQEGNWDAMVYEFKNYPLLSFGKRQLTGIEGFLWVRVSAFLSEPRRFFWNYHVYPFSILFLVSYIFTFRYLYKFYRPLMIYCTLFILGISFLVSTKSPHYLIYFYPYMALISSIAIFYAINKKNTYLNFIFIAAFLIQFYNLNYLFVTIINRNDDFVTRHETHLKEVPDQSGRILVPYEYIFNAMTEYDLINTSGFAYYQMDLGSEFTKDTFFQRAIDLNIDFILLDKENYKHERSWMPSDLTEENEYYELILDKEKFYLLKAKSK